MGLFSKLFSKKEEKQKLPKEEPFHFDSPYCRFYYISNPDYYHKDYCDIL